MLVGPIETNKIVKIKQLHFPEVNKNMDAEQHKMIVFNSNCQYDDFLEVYFLQKAGININYVNSQIEWLNGHLPLQDPNLCYDDNKNLLANCLLTQEEEEWFGDNFMELFSTTILDAE